MPTLTHTDGKPINIRQLLHEFNTVFGHTPLDVQINGVAGQYVYLRVLYAKDVLITDENAWPDTTLRTVHPGETHDQSLMVKLWLNTDHHEIVSGVTSRPAEYRLLLWKDGIYANPYTLSDYGMYKAFEKAREKWAGGPLPLLQDKYLVTLGETYRKATLNQVIQRIRSCGALLAGFNGLDIDDRVVDPDTGLHTPSPIILWGKTPRARVQELLLELSSLRDLYDYLRYEATPLAAKSLPETDGRRAV